MSFRQILSQFWSNVQYTLFPQLEKDLGELSPDHKKLVAILELVRIEEFIPCGRFTNGRLKEDRSAIARAFIAKIVFKLPYTKNILKELKNDKQLKKICGWECLAKLPLESKLSRAFNEFSKLCLPEKVHQALIKEVYKDKIVGHVVKDSMPLEAREKYLKNVLRKIEIK